MGQKCNPIGLRLCTGRDHASRWYADDKLYSNMVCQDYLIRQLAFKVFSYAYLSKVLVRRFGNAINVALYSSKPGLITGKRVDDIDLFRSKVIHISSSSIKNEDVDIDVLELKNADADAVLIAKSIAYQLERRSSFRRAIKMAIESAIRAGVRGIKVACSGRLNGADIARVESFKHGSMPLHRLRADIDYWMAEAHTTYGVIGIKVWVFKGDFVNLQQLVE